MVDRGYWGRLAQGGARERRQHDHPLGFEFGTLRRAVIPALAMLREVLTTETQQKAFDRVILALEWFSGQLDGTIEEGRAMSRALKELEHRVAHDRDLASLQMEMRSVDGRRFDEEGYRRSIEAHRDLSELPSTLRGGWDEPLANGHHYEREMERWRAR